MCHLQGGGKMALVPVARLPDAKRIGKRTFFMAQQMQEGALRHDAKRIGPASSLSLFAL